MYRHATPNIRIETLEEIVRRAEQAGFDIELQRARSLENELSRALQLEETELNDLISRVERLTESSR